MAKLKGPLFSLGASQKLGDALVYFNWKGLNVVREYVIPANPKTDAQNLQRGRLTTAVAAIHAAQVEAVNPFDAADTIAYALLGSLHPTPRTWFNELVRQWIKQFVATKLNIVWCNGSATPAATSLVIKLAGHGATGAVVTSGYLHYGTSKTNLVHRLLTTPTQLDAGKTIPNLTAGVKYFVQYRPDTPGNYANANSGIYYGVPTA